MIGIDPGVMRRAAIAAAALAVYGVASSWLVSREASAYRAGLRRESEVRAVAVAPPAEPKVESRVEPPPRSSADPRAKPGPDANALPPAPAPAVKAAVPAGPPAKPKAEPDPEPPDPFWSRPLLKKVWDLDRMTPQDETSYGQALHQVIQALDGVSPNESSLDRVHRASRPLVDLLASRHAAREGMTYTFEVLPSLERNAFSTPGGFVYVTEGLLLSIPEDQEYILQYVLAHEMGHIEQGHALACLRNSSLRQNQDRGTLELHYNIVIPWGYFDDQDYAADRWALDALGQSGLKRDRHESLAFLHSFAKFAEKNHFAERGRVRPDLKADRSLVDNHFRAHVSINERLKRAKAFLDGKPIPDPKRLPAPTR